MINKIPVLDAEEERGEMFTENSVKQTMRMTFWDA